MGTLQVEEREGRVGGDLVDVVLGVEVGGEVTIRYSGGGGYNRALW